ncbi:hypothetical protein SAMN02745121_04542 [Nannocystis exedens]|uniref:Uncharacterized protein n=1 Tax=Nannocystis exedens TaxID=54 RepID=A0A1I2B9E6_9BACT|nr:hypothetical protein [Nannocystis exedens]PCC68113.1 hypothetical protein NAEX_01122 [Nannocystis exedens]SFE52716.1 hypothetical protein SAMN02745121_04542 [Nannocystis exedens]
MRPVLFFLAFAVGACRIPNPDHCVHKDVDSDAWCAENSPARPFCSPCEAEGHGCVAAAPDPEACPAYEPDGTGTTDSSTG